jgi:hypothetical protein
MIWTDESHFVREGEPIRRVWKRWPRLTALGWLTVAIGAVWIAILVVGINFLIAIAQGR